MIDAEILYKPCPYIYDLEPGKDNQSLVFKVNQSGLDIIKRDFKICESPLVMGLTKNLNLEDFLDLNEGDIGFGGVLNLRGMSSSGSWIYEIPLESREKRDDYFVAVSASLNVVMKFLGFIKTNQIDSYAQQLLTTDLSTFRDLNGGSLSVSVSPTMCEFLKTISPTDNEVGLKKVMREAYGSIYKNLVSSLDLYRFQAMIKEPYYFNLTVPGNACGLDPDDYYPRANRGYRMGGHNVDSTRQQLTLLMGLAELNRRARAQGY